MYIFSVFLSEGLYRDPSDVATDQNGGLAHMKNTKVSQFFVHNQDHIIESTRTAE